MKSKIYFSLWYLLWLWACPAMDMDQNAELCMRPPTRQSMRQLMNLNAQ